MRTLYEIVEAVKSNESVEHDELFYAVVALSALHFFDFKALQDLAKNERGPKWVGFQAQESQRRFRAALKKSPKDYCGERDDPRNPECQKFRKAAFRVLDQVMRKIDGEEKAGSDAPRAGSGDGDTRHGRANQDGGVPGDLPSGEAETSGT